MRKTRCDVRGSEVTTHTHTGKSRYSVQVTNKIKFSYPELVWAALRSIIPSLCSLKRALGIGMIIGIGTMGTGRLLTAGLRQYRTRQGTRASGMGTMNGCGHGHRHLLGMKGGVGGLEGSLDRPLSIQLACSLNFSTSSTASHASFVMDEERHHRSLWACPS